MNVRERQCYILLDHWKPKGVSREINLSPLPYDSADDDLGLTRVVQGLYSADEESIYLSPALYIILPQWVLIPDF